MIIVIIQVCRWCNVNKNVNKRHSTESVNTAIDELGMACV